MKIGIFDSGHGGRYSLELCQAALPQHEFVGYFDHQNAPYGHRPPEQIYDLTLYGVNNLFDQKCDLVLLACNTASARALRKLQEKKPDKKILGCLVPAIEQAIEQGGKNIGIIATQHTVHTRKYEREAFKVDPLVKVFTRATPQLVPWIENLPTPKGGLETFSWPTELQTYLNTHIDFLVDQHQIDTLILGCTHYHVFLPWCTAHFPNLNIVSSAQAQAEKLVDYLQRHPELH